MKKPRISAKVGDEKVKKKFEIYFSEIEISPWDLPRMKM